MKESYGEGLANHTSLESCGNCSNVKAEALTEASTGGLLSSEITYFRVPTKWSDGEGNICCSDMRVAEQPRRSLRTWHVWTSFTRESGYPYIFPKHKSYEERPVKEKFCTTGMTDLRKLDNNIVPENILGHF